MIAPDDFRHVLGHFASGVTIITTCDADGRPTGLTASAFTSVSLDPPLILVCVDHKSQSYPALRERGRFAVNILAPRAGGACRAGSRPRGSDKFDGVPSPDQRRSGLPLLDGALAQLECTTVNVHLEGDHTIFVGRVEARARRRRATPCSTSAAVRPAGRRRQARDACAIPLSRPPVDDEIKQAVLAAIDSRQYILGPQCRSFEAELAALRRRAATPC